MAYEFIIHALGTRGSRPVSGKMYQEFGGATTCYVMRWEDKALIVDCGTGLYQAKEVLKGCREIYIVITHVHYDHILGLLAWGVFPKDAKIKIIGNFTGLGTADFVEDLFARPHWPISPLKSEYEYIEAKEKMVLSDDIVLETYPTGHCDGAIMCIAYIEGHKVSFLFDYEFSPIFDKDHLQDSEVLIFDGMFAQDEYEQYIGWGHSYWERGCAFAKDKNIKNLIITHHKPESTDDELRAREILAKAQFSNTIFIRDMDLLAISDSGFRYIKGGSQGTRKDMYYQMVMDRLIQKALSQKGGVTLLDSIEAVLQIVMGAVQGEAGTFWFYDQLGDQLIHPQIFRGESDLSDITLSPGRGIAGEVIQGGKCVLVQDCKQDKRWDSSIDTMTGFTTRSMICLPLKILDNTFGCIQIINKKDQTLYTDEDMDFTNRLLHKTMEMFVDNGLFAQDKRFCEFYKIN